MTRFTVSPSLDSFFSAKYIAPNSLEERVAALRAEGKTIVTLNGSFDLLHAGHLQMIYEASLQGDILIVALNSDASIQKYKNPNRPIISLKERLLMMAAIGFVGYVTSFEETDPRALLQKIKPHVHVNGAEYGENCIEAAVVKENGGRLHIVTLVPGLSTSNILNKIRTTCA
jgi:rfaE bifunctional protein nucleotidyltransferase chain/domain